MRLPYISLPSRRPSRPTHGSQILLAFALSAMSSILPLNAQTYFNLSAGNYLENFTNAATWANLTSVGNSNSNSFSGVAIATVGAIPVATHTSVATTSFATSSISSGVHHPTTNIQLLATGSINNTTAVAVDLNLNLSGRTSGSLSFNAATVFNGSGDRQGTLRIYHSIDNSTWTELTGVNLPYVATNNIIDSRTITATLPPALDHQAQVKLRFYYHNESTGTAGNRPKISIDDVAVNSAAIGGPDITPPLFSMVSPTHGATGVLVNTNLVATFNEPVVAGTGNIVIKNVSDNSSVAIIPVSDSQITGFGTSSITINPTLDLVDSTAYYVEIPSGAINDTTGNNFVGISGNSTWSFATVDVPALTNTPYTQTFSTYLSAATLPSGWSAVGGPTYLSDYTGDWAITSEGGFRGNANVYGYHHTSSTQTASPPLQQILTLRNNTGAVITDLTVAYKGRSELAANTRIPVYTVSVAGTEIVGLSYSSADGDATQRHESIGGMNVAVGATFQIKWNSNYPMSSGISRQIGISDVSVSVGSSTFPPTVAGLSIPVTTTTFSTVTANAKVISSGGLTVTARGFIYALTSVNSNPQIGGIGVSIVTDTAPAIGVYTTGINSLAAATNYTIRGYATNSLGSSYTAPIAFATLPLPPVFITHYLQEFDNYLGTNPAGWTAFSDSATPLQSYAGAWGMASTTGGFLGGASNPGVLGYRHTSTSGNLTVTLRLINGTGTNLTSLNVSYLGRAKVSTSSPEGRSPQWTVSITDGATTTIVPELAFSTASGLDATMTATLSGLTIAPGAEFSLAWVSDRDTSGSGSSKQIGIAQISVAVPSTSGYASWKTLNASGQGPLMDFDNDGVNNGVEYFFGTTGSSFTQNPQPDLAGKISFPHPAPTPGASYKVFTSPNLTNWTDVTASTVLETGFITYTLPASQGKIFARLQVDITP